MNRRKTFLLSGATLLVGGALAFAPAMAAETTPQPVPPPHNGMMKNSGAATTGTATTGNQKQAQSKNHATKLVQQAIAEVRKMEKDPQLKKLMAKAKGIYLVPEFGRGAFIVGGRGGAGLVMTKLNGVWTDPAFYNFGAISFGAQVGGSGGQVAFLLMDKSAVDAFKSGNKIALNAGAGLSIVTYSANGQASWGKGDIIMWSNTKGAYAGATVSVTDINWDDDTSKAFYGRKVDPANVLAGKVTTPDAAKLKAALPG